MLCNKIDKLIVLADIAALDINEKKAISEHIEKCELCKQKVLEMKEYQQFIQTIRNIDPELTNCDELTNTIMNSIEYSGSTNKNMYKKSGIKIMRISYKIAASIMLFLLIGYYVQQKTYVNNMTAELEVTYTGKSKNSPFVNNYNECLEYSEKYIKQMASDDSFSKTLREIFRRNPFKIYDNYTSAICLQSNVDFQKADIELKKKMIIDLLNSDLNQN